MALHLKPQDGVLEPVKLLEAIEARGIVGDYSFDKPERQVSLLSLSELNEFGYIPGQLRENITVDFEGLQSLPVGSVLLVGGTELVIESDCPPCRSMAMRLREDPREFVKKMIGKRGMLAKVARTGTIRIGDVVHLVGG